MFVCIMGRRFALGSIRNCIFATKLFSLYVDLYKVTENGIGERAQIVRKGESEKTYLQNIITQYIIFFTTTSND